MMAKEELFIQDNDVRRPFTDDELMEFNELKAKAAADREASEAASKAATRAALLEQLGISEEQMKALLA